MKSRPGNAGIINLMTQPFPNLTLRRLLFVVGALLVSVNLLSAIWDLRNSHTVV